MRYIFVDFDTLEGDNDNADADSDDADDANDSYSTAIPNKRYAERCSACHRAEHSNVSVMVLAGKGYDSNGVRVRVTVRQ